MGEWSLGPHVYDATDPGFENSEIYVDTIAKLG